MTRMLFLLILLQVIVFADEIYYDKYTLLSTQQDRLLQVEQLGMERSPL